VSSSSKPLSSWTARDAIQQCREACGGHGFLAGTNMQPHPLITFGTNVKISYSC